MTYPIYIPSKGRADNCITAEILLGEGIDFNIVVEPQDEISYREKYENVIVMKENDRGIAYARNFCKAHSIDSGAKWHWQFDDNIKAFRTRTPEIKRVTARWCIDKAEKYIAKYNGIGICSFKHQMFSHMAKTDISYNQMAYSGVLVNNEVDIWWEPDIVEDADYTLRLLFKGYCSIMFNRLIMDKVATGEIKGGNTEIEYGANRRLVRYQNLMQRYKGYFKVGRQYGRAKLYPSRIWSQFKQRPKPKEK